MAQKDSVILAAICLVAGSANLVGQESVKPLRSIDDVLRLSYEEARSAPPVSLKVTVISHLDSGFDGQDHSGGIFFEWRDGEIPPVRETVEIKGNVTGGFYGPYIIVDEVRKKGRGNMPRPLNFQPEFIQTGLGDNRWIEIEGLLVDAQFSPNKRRGEGILVTGQNKIIVRFRNRRRDFDTSKLKKMVGSWVRLKGSGAPLFNDRRQRIGSDLICSIHDFVEMVQETKNVPVVSLDEIGRWDSRRTAPGLIQTTGTVTLVEDPRTLILQSGDHGARIRSLRPYEAAVGDHLAFTGLPDSDGYFVGLRYASASEVDESEDEVAEPIPVKDNTPGTRSHALQLVTLQGKFIERQGRLLNLQQGGQLVSVRVAKAIPINGLPTVGSEIAVTGVKLVDADERGELRSVTVATRRPNDITVLAVPSWWTPAATGLPSRFSSPACSFSFSSPSA